MRIVVAFIALVVGCSSGGSNGGTTSSSGSSSGGVEATCGDANKTVIVAVSGESNTTTTADTRSWGWVNFGKSHFDGTWDGGGTIHLEWAGSIADGEVADLTAATISVASGTFKSGKLVYDSPDKESVLKASITFDSGTVTVCMRKTDSP
jgi:hypothetical protein